jgi:molybdenum cofactor cytidylyltransferase
MFRLGEELALAGQRVLLTTTTRIAAEQTAWSPAHVTFDSARQTLSGCLPQLESALERHGQVLLTGPIAIGESQGKALGVHPEVVDRLAALNLCQAIIVEADGSKKRPFKAPAPYEPVIPGSTSLAVPVVGLDVLGQPLTEVHVHRPEQVARLAQVSPGEPVTADVVARVIAHADGGLKGLPATARVVALLNKLDAVSPDEARTLARLLLEESRIYAVVAGSVGKPAGVAWVENRVAAVVLAAGQASRFGAPKQLALWQSKSLLAHVVDAALASRAARVIVVLGAHADACREALAGRPVEIIFNPDWAAGQSTSVKAGLAALPGHISAALFPLADQPFVTAADIDAVISTYQRTLAPIVWPEYEGQRGNPVLFDRRLFPEMMQVTGDTGARPVLQAHRAEAERVVVANAGVLRDVDTPGDLRLTIDD